VNPHDRDLEALLRRALAEEAGRVEPAADGLRRIRERTAAQPWRVRWSRWSAPALALAGAAAVITAVAVLPTVTPDGGDRAGPAAGGTTGPPGPTLPPTTAPPTTATLTSPPSRTSTGQVADLPTVWPYATRYEGAARAEADIRDGRYPHLRDPARTAVDFVGSYLGAGGLTVTRLDAYPPGLRMLVRRDGRPVTTVFLVRVRTGNDAPYVVVSASRAGLGEPETLTVSPPPAVDIAGVEVRGTVQRAAGAADPRLIVQLRPPGSSGVLADAELTVPLTGPEPAGWSVTLTPAAPAPTGVVAAWTVDANGEPVEFVAAPTATG
jgi:hypothetical protein